MLPSVVKKMFAGSLADNATACDVAKLPPAGVAVTVGGVVSLGLCPALAPTLVNVAVASVPATWLETASPAKTVTGIVIV
jgi:hypothetical protein